MSGDEWPVTVSLSVTQPSPLTSDGATVVVEVAPAFDVREAYVELLAGRDVAVFEAGTGPIVPSGQARVSLGDLRAGSRHRVEIPVRFAGEGQGYAVGVVRGSGYYPTGGEELLGEGVLGFTVGRELTFYSDEGVTMAQRDSVNYVFDQAEARGRPADPGARRRAMRDLARGGSRRASDEGDE